ncbi:MAG: tRNA sulfurtransferase [Hadesarchaea archaeon]|nr:tRNA sulfurtransferase [Hadesarchaea archaeon]
MNQTVLVRYDEIALKKQPVRGRFEKILVQNISRVLKDMKIRVKREHGRILIETLKPRETAERVARIPGVVSTSPSQKTRATLEEIQDLAEEIAIKRFRREGTFAVSTHRTGSHDYSSQDINEEIGTRILNKIPSLTVDLDNPDQELFIEIRQNDAYVFTEIISGIGGLPVGAQEKSISLFQGDQASFLATLLMLKRGSRVQLVFTDLYSSGEKTSERKQVLEISEQLKKFHSPIKIQVIPFKPIINEIPTKSPEDLTGIISWRVIMKTLEKISRNQGAEAIITSGEMTRDESWSLQELSLIERGIKTPILRPLTGFTEDEIHDINKEVNEFDFIKDPKKMYPKINPRGVGRVNFEELERIEDSLCINELIDQALQKSSEHEF